MQEYIRRVTCDCCGKEVSDIVDGLRIRTINSRVYDICLDCHKHLVSAEWMFYECYMANSDWNRLGDYSEGRSPWFNQEGRPKSN